MTAPDGNESGTSLIEVLTTILLLGIVLAVVYEGIASLSGAAEGTGVRLQNLDEGRVIMAAATKDVRTATQPDSGASAFLSAGPSSVSFYANINNPGAAASLVNLFVNGSTELVEEVTPATNASGTTPCSQQPCSYLPAKKTTRFVGKFVVNDPVTDPLFTFLDVNNSTLGAGGTLTVSERLQVRSVRIELAVSKSHAHNVGTTVIRNTVGLPNIAFQQQTS